METINNNSGFQDITENIFMSLDHKCLVNCSKVNIFWQRILKNPRFWLKKCVSLKIFTKEQENKWTKIINFLKNTNLEFHLTSYLMKIHLVFENEANLMKSPRSPFKMAFRSALLSKTTNKKMYLEHVEIINFLLTTTKIEELNEPFANGWTPIQYACEYGLTEIVKIIAPLVKCPIALNAPGGPSGYTPIHRAVILRHREIVKILAPLVDNPNSSAPKTSDRTPIQDAALQGDFDIVKILVPLSIPNNRPDTIWRQISQIKTKNLVNEIERHNLPLQHKDFVSNCPCPTLIFHY